MKYCLLDHLAEQTQVHYVSELKDKELVKPYASYIQSIRDDKFSLEDWKDTCAYLLQESNGIDCVEEAKKRIIDWLKP